MKSMLGKSQVSYWILFTPAPYFILIKSTSGIITPKDSYFYLLIFCVKLKQVCRVHRYSYNFNKWLYSSSLYSSLLLRSWAYSQSICVFARCGISIQTNVSDTPSNSCAICNDYEVWIFSQRLRRTSLWTGWALYSASYNVECTLICRSVSQ